MKASAAPQPIASEPMPRDIMGVIQNPEEATPLQTIILPLVRNRWLGLTTRNYTIETVRTILDSTNGNRLYHLLTMFELMIDTWPRLAKNLHELRLNASNEEYTIHPFREKGKDPTPSAIEKADFVQKMFGMMRGDSTRNIEGFNGMLYDLLDAFGKGVAVLEMIWEKRGGEYWLNGTRWLRPVYFDYPIRFDMEDRLMLSPSGRLNDFVDFPDNKFIVAKYKVRSADMVTKVGLLRSLAPWWVFTNFAVEWLMNYSQLFGVPIRWANYNPAIPGQKDVVADMLDKMGSAGYGAFPQGTTLNLIESSKGTAQIPQAYLIEAADQYADLLILGQSMTGANRSPGQSQAGGSRALGEVHERGKYEREGEAKDWVWSVVNDQVIPKIIELNYGNKEELPHLGKEVDESEDPQTAAARDKTLLVDIGMEVSKEWLYERHKVPMPVDEEDTFKAQPATAAGAGAPGSGDPTDPMSGDAQAPAGATPPGQGRKPGAPTPPGAKNGSKPPPKGQKRPAVAQKGGTSAPKGGGSSQRGGQPDKARQGAVKAKMAEAGIPEEVQEAVLAMPGAMQDRYLAKMGVQV